MVNNIKLKLEFMQDNIIITENELKNMQNNEIISSNSKDKFN